MVDLYISDSNALSVAAARLPTSLEALLLPQVRGDAAAIMIG